jgi:ubiquinone/menaquinone biosynthesis C-methylase UbiE
VDKLDFSENDIKDSVRENYAKVAKSENVGCCNGSSCCGGSENEDILKIGEKLGYSQIDLESDFIEANQGLGCGNPTAIANLNEGETVLDLGCGGGFDAFIAARKVGVEGYVIGVDMTPEMISKARKSAEKNEFTSVDFRLDEIEHLPIADNAIDVVISNCVINLSTDKEAVFAEIFRVLKPGGRMAISDIVRSREFPEEIKNDIKSYSNCIAGALHYEELEKILKDENFKDISIEGKENSDEIVSDWSSQSNIEDIIFSAYITCQKPKS